MKNFRTFDLAVDLYRKVLRLNVSGPAQDQLHRAALSISLNLAEGTGRATAKDQRRFFHIAMESTREVQALFILLGVNNAVLCDRLDHIAASLHRLIHASRA
jgi:four helix bundle protein